MVKKPWIGCHPQDFDICCCFLQGRSCLKCPVVCPQLPGHPCLVAGSHEKLWFVVASFWWKATHVWFTCRLKAGERMISWYPTTIVGNYQYTFVNSSQCQAGPLKSMVPYGSMAMRIQAAWSIRFHDSQLDVCHHQPTKSWVDERPKKDSSYSGHFWDLHQVYRVLTDGQLLNITKHHWSATMNSIIVINGYLNNY